MKVKESHREGVTLFKDSKISVVDTRQDSWRGNRIERANSYRKYKTLKTKIF